MRGAFARTLAELAEKDERIILLTGDLGYMALEPFADRFPDRFMNAGVAEQNMVGVATGLAEAGFIPFVYSIVTFATLRPYEFIRNGPVQHRLPVRVVGVGGGFEYGTNGLSHYGLEDVAVMRTQPNMRVVAPADAEQTRSALLATWDLPGPTYYRLGKDDKTLVAGLNGRFTLDGVDLLGDGADVLILTLGNIATEARAACEELSRHGIQSTLGTVASINPPPTEALIGLLSRFKACVTVEAHYLSGGLGSLVAEVIAENGINCRLGRCAVRELPQGISGSQYFLYEKHGIARGAIVDKAFRVLGR